MEIATENLATNRENWRSIDGYSNYEVSWWGWIRNVGTNRILKQRPGVAGYMILELSKSGKAKTHYVHRLVAQEWVSNPEGRRCVDHIDGDRVNNHHENLRPATHSENCRNTKNTSMDRVSTKGFRFTHKQTSGMQEL